MERILFRYLLREMLGPFALGLGVFLFVLFTNRLVPLLELVFNKGGTLLYVGKVMLTLLPSFLVYAIPMAFILAILLGYGRLSSDSEITAMRASGMGLWKLTRPAFETGLFLALLCVMLSVWALPWGRHQFAIEVYKLASNQVSIGLQERVFNNLGTGLMLYADQVDKGNLKGVLLSDTRKEDTAVQVFAEGGVLRTSEGEPVLDLDLRKGRILSGGPVTDTARVVDFDRLELHVDLRAGLSTRNYYLISEMNLAQLEQELAERRAKKQKLAPVWIEIFKKFSLPLGCIIFPFLGVPLAMTNRRAGRSQGFVSALVVMAIYYMLITTGQSAANKGTIPAFWGTFMADFVLAAAAGWFFWRRAGDNPLIPRRP
jgi:lipopolysaccharide export system permease protein